MDSFLVFDLETQRGAQDVGGWDYVQQMRMSVGCVWDNTKQSFFTYYEDQVHEMIDHLTSGALVIGYNHLFFDYTVLSGYAKDGDWKKQLTFFQDELPNFDLLVAIRNQLKKRLKLDSLARPTLQVGKSADGLLALQWWKEYCEGDKKKLDMITEYCMQDVAVTRDLYLFGKQNEYVLYEDLKHNIQQLQVDWSNPLQAKKEKQDQLSLF